MTTIYGLLDGYSSMARYTREKGHLFERLVHAFLLTDQLYAAQHDKVWLWQDWPGRDGKADTRVDLVARDRFSGGLCTIQCKFYAPGHDLQKSDIDSFFTASGKHPFTSRRVFHHEQLVKHGTVALANQQIRTWRLGVDDLAESDIDWSQYST